MPLPIGVSHLGPTLPVHVFQSELPGPTAIIEAGIHGDEVAGDLAGTCTPPDEIAPAAIAGMTATTPTTTTATVYFVAPGDDGAVGSPDFDLRVDYQQAPPPPELSPEEHNWLDAILRERGLR